MAVVHTASTQSTTRLPVGRPQVIDAHHMQGPMSPTAVTSRHVLSTHQLMYVSPSDTPSASRTMHCMTSTASTSSNSANVHYVTPIDSPSARQLRHSAAAVTPLPEGSVPYATFNRMQVVPPLMSPSARHMHATAERGGGFSNEASPCAPGRFSSMHVVPPDMSPSAQHMIGGTHLPGHMAHMKQPPSPAKSPSAKLVMHEPYGRSSSKSSSFVSFFMGSQ
eukprot:TRINITY_DN12455_c0_g1_i1.p1 TRINITY_DN12455_c0_g1~~TRINITY_DN12455_c0_g1_i1.p1  ORF type:complete len:221 (+),score=14.81 TRINITY_DN12455_c0_g1_i1:93-755(+)